MLIKVYCEYLKFLRKYLSKLLQKNKIDIVKSRKFNFNTFKYMTDLYKITLDVSI